MPNDDLAMLVMSTRSRRLRNSTKTAFPRVTDTLHRRHYTFLALSRPFAPFYNIFTLLYPSPSIPRGHVYSAFTGSPKREHLTRCYI